MMLLLTDSNCRDSNQKIRREKKFRKS